MKQIKAKTLTQISLCVAILAITSQISFYIGAVPITLQVMFVSLAGYLLGAKKGGVCVVIYILLGLAGAPVFSGLMGGAYVLLGYTGGFIFGFLPFCVLCGLGKKAKDSIILGIIGLLICHLTGVIQYMHLSGVSLWQSMLVSSLPFLAKDTVLVILSYFLSKTVKSKILI